ncbi:MAG: hypothetical protein J5663_03350 [Bacteroidaceae bacterium]|nr:hypothetical protein [Bacteroidaceae bacterium]
MKAFRCIIFFLCVFPFASAMAQNDSVSLMSQLGEVVVTSKYIQQDIDHYNCIPTSSQRRHSHSGFELVRNMMITGVNVDTETGAITTPAGVASLYINGREATYREIQSLRSKDIVRVEYYDMPTGKYAKDNAALNYVVKSYTYGGYTQLDATQGVGYKKGIYNVVSKYSSGKFNVNVWAGYNMSNPKENTTLTEMYKFPSLVTKTTNNDCVNNDKTGKYITASLSRMSQMTIWMIRASIEGEKQNNDALLGNTQYESQSFTDKANSQLISNTRTTKPTLYIYYDRSINKTQSIDAVFDGYYARNTYYRDLHEDDRFTSDVEEDYLYAKGNINYHITLPQQNNLTFSLHEYLRVSDDKYKNLDGYNQHLLSSESIFFVDYSKRWKHIMLDVNPGISCLRYELREDNPVTHIAPRMQFSLSWMPDKIQRLRGFFSLGNTFPTLSTINHVQQRIDRFMVRQGNPEMDNSTLLGPGITYTINYNKWSALLSNYYMYMSDAIVNTYSMDGDHVINSFSSNATSHQSATSLSITWKQSSCFNMKLDGNYTYYAVNGTAHERLNSWQFGMQANYYLGDFSFIAYCKSKTKLLNSYQTHVELPWQYGLSAEWSHNNLSLIAEAKNLFADNAIESFLTSDVYCMNKRQVRKSDNSFASLKVIYSFDYGRKVSRSPKYETKSAESNILK